MNTENIDIENTVGNDTVSRDRLLRKQMATAFSNGAGELQNCERCIKAAGEVFEAIKMQELQRAKRLISSKP